MKRKKMMTVGLLLYDDCTLMDFAGAHQVFSAPLNNFNPILLGKKRCITTSENLSILTDYLLDDHPHIDLLFIPGGSSSGVVPMMTDEVFLDFIRRVSAKAKWRGSVCTGAFILAAAGLLKDVEATTYWSVIPQLSMLSKAFNLAVPKNFPRYLVNEKNKIFTGGGISSSIDLSLELVLRIQGKAIAQKTQLFIQYQPDPPVQAGDPLHAPVNITKEVMDFELSNNEAYTQAVEDLLQRLS